MRIETTGGNHERVRVRTALLLGCTALVALPSTSLRAQEIENSGSATVLETITVKGGGDDDANSIVATQTTSGSKMATDILDTPASISVITAKEMEERGVKNVEDALKYTAGVTTDFYGSDDRFDFFKIRGFDALTYRDGLRLGAPFGGIREEPYAYERIEVLKGANSTVFGVSDPGGSVNFVTKRPKRERFGEAYVTGGSFDHAEIGFDFGDNVTADDTLSFRMTGKLQNADAEYDYSRDDEKFFMGGLTWRPTDMTNLTVVYDHLDKDGVPGGGGHPVGTDFDRSRFFGEPDFNYRGVDRDSVSVMFDHDFGTGLTFNANARYSDESSNFGYAYISGTPTDGSTIAERAFFANDSAAERFIIDAHLQYDTSFEFVDSRTLVGVEYNNTSSTNNGYFSNDAPGIDWTNPVYTGAPESVPPYTSTNTDQKTTAIYVEQNLTFADRLIATIGLRNDWIDISETNNLAGTTSDGDISELTSRFGLTYRFTNEFAAYASYAESVVPASLGVEPERGEQYEIGVKYRPDAFPALFTASVYDLTKNNITRTNPATGFEEAIGEVRVRGIDLEAKAEMMYNLSLTAAYSYMKSEIVENGAAGFEGNELSFVPNQVASLWLNYDLKGNGTIGDMTFGLGARYQSSYYFDNANTQWTGDSIVFDAAYTYDIRENTTFEVNVSNLFDEKYVAYGGFGADFYNPGRAVFATLRHTW
ncbi:TonB-dependent siderophore receptor [Mesorhizobium xinjiangense]|uniref:TonB-dependent siderophore receptor n=1 Tax=Mesorhizobium xinjiangense TaxID=2678685 RepID=UPI0012EEC22F|nr:TonB-dependent siderophore receptor [Mesorhizobium xinjiangense]